MLIRGLVVLGAAAALAACADNIVQTASLAGTGAACFKPSDVIVFDQISDSDVIIHTMNRETYSAQLPACRGMDFAQTVGLRPIRSSQVCEGDQATLVTQDPGGRAMTCTAFSFHKLSPAEVAMLPDSAQVKDR